LAKQSQHHCCRWDCSQAFVPWDLLVMRAQVQTHLPLNDAVNQQADDGQHRQGGNAFRFLKPHGGHGCGVLDPTNALIGFQGLT
jgi:hypothetical protein